MSQVESFVAREFLGLDDESSGDLSRVDDAVIGKIERPDAILRKRGNRAGRSSGQIELPDLPWGEAVGLGSLIL